MRTVARVTERPGGERRERRAHPHVAVRARLTGRQIERRAGAVPSRRSTGWPRNATVTSRKPRARRRHVDRSAVLGRPEALRLGLDAEVDAVEEVARGAGASHEVGLAVDGGDVDHDVDTRVTGSTVYRASVVISMSSAARREAGRTRRARGPEPRRGAVRRAHSGGARARRRPGRDACGWSGSGREAPSPVGGAGPGRRRGASDPPAAALAGWRPRPRRRRRPRPTQLGPTSADAEHDQRGQHGERRAARAVGPPATRPSRRGVPGRRPRAWPRRSPWARAAPAAVRSASGSLPDHADPAEEVVVRGRAAPRLGDREDRGALRLRPGAGLGEQAAPRTASAGRPAAGARRARRGRRGRCAARAPCARPPAGRRPSRSPRRGARRGRRAGAASRRRWPASAGSEARASARASSAAASSGGRPMHATGRRDPRRSGLEHVQQAAPVGRAADGLERRGGRPSRRAAGRRRCRRDVRPGRARAPRARRARRHLRDERVGGGGRGDVRVVAAGRRRERVAAGPGGERPDGRRAPPRRRVRRRHRRPERLGRAQRVPAREALVRPSFREQLAIEPGVG